MSILRRRGEGAGWQVPGLLPLVEQGVCAGDGALLSPLLSPITPGLVQAALPAPPAPHTSHRHSNHFSKFFSYLTSARIGLNWIKVVSGEISHVKYVKLTEFELFLLCHRGAAPHTHLLAGRELPTSSSLRLKMALLWHCPQEPKLM